MNKWKIIHNITIGLLIIFLIPILWWFIEAVWYDINGISVAAPGPSLTKWYDIFLFNMLPYLLYFIIPAIIDVIVLIISVRKIKR